MSNRRRKRTAITRTTEAIVADLGPGITRDARGRPESGFAVETIQAGKPKTIIHPGAAAVTVENRPDPSIPDRNVLVRGARRRLVLRDMLDHGTITKRHHDAATRFVDDLSMASGPSGVGNLSGVRTAPGSRDGMSPAQAAAIRAVQQVVHLLGLNRDTVFWWVVVDNGSLRGYEERYQRQHGTARRWLTEALAALDRHYFGVRGL
jgi:hypothetical protein